MKQGKGQMGDDEKAAVRNLKDEKEIVPSIERCQKYDLRYYTDK